MFSNSEQRGTIAVPNENVKLNLRTFQGDDHVILLLSLNAHNFMMTVTQKLC